MNRTSPWALPSPSAGSVDRDAVGDERPFPHREAAPDRRGAISGRVGVVVAPDQRHRHRLPENQGFRVRRLPQFDDALPFGRAVSCRDR